MVKGTQRRILAALLARAGRPVGVGELVDLLWDDDPPPNAIRNVRSYVAKLKRTFEASGPSPVESGPSGYTLRVRAGELDSIDFADAVRRAIGAERAGEHATANLLLDRALRLWQGDPFADIEESPFLRPEVERLRQCQLQALELGLELGRGSELIPELGRLVERHPYQERPIALLMRALNDSGRQAEAQQVFREARHRLVEDLGVDPSAELSELHEALLRGDRDDSGIRRAVSVGSDRKATEHAEPSTPAPAATIDPLGSPNRESPPPRLVLVDHMPQPPRVFQPREACQRRLDMSADATEPVVCTVTGARGVGKTQLVAAHARARLSRGDAVFWVNADTRENVVAGLADVAALAGVRGGDQDFEEAARHARRWLSSFDRPTLLVFDNANEPGTIREWLPRSGAIQVVITSTRRVFEWLGENMELGAFDRDEARSFLDNATGLTRDDTTERVIDEVGQYALALALASAVITTEQLSYADYLRRLRNLPARRSLGAYEGDPYPHGVVEAIRLSLDSVRHTTGARALAEHIAVLAPAGTRRTLLVPEVLDEHGRADRTHALAVLADAYLANYAEDGQLLVMHPLTRRVLLELCAEEGRSGDLLRSVTSMLADHLERTAADAESHRTWQEALGHLESLLAIVARTDPDTNVRAELLTLCTSVVGHFHNRCDFVSAAPLNAAVHSEQRKLLGADDPATLRSCTELARQYRRLAKLDQAIELLEETLDRQRQRLGEEHPDTWWTWQTLAGTHLVSGRAYRAITMLREMVAVEQGPDAPVRLGSNRRLAWALRSVGQLEESTAIYRALVPEYERLYGPEHPQTFRTRSEFACVHRCAGRLDTANEMLTELIASRERALGGAHPDQWQDRERLADVRRGAGEPREAREIFEAAAAHWQETLGDRHPWTLIARNNVACAAESTGALDAAYALFGQLHRLHDEVLGPALPRTLNVAHNHAAVLALRGGYAEATAMFADVLDGRRHVLGEDHPDTRTTRDSLALVRERLGPEDASFHAQGAVPVREEPLPRWLRDGCAYGSGRSVDSTIRLSAIDLP